MKVKYTGTSNYRVLASRDLDKAGVEHNKITFERDIATEVPDEVGDALINHGLFGGEFEQVEDDAETKSSKRKSRRSSDDSEMADSGTTQESTGDAAGSTGRGSTAGTGTGGTSRGSTTRTR